MSVKNIKLSETFQVIASAILDSYKLGHGDMYPEGTEMVYSNLTPRSMKHFGEAGSINRITWFGFQGVLIDLIRQWDEHFFKLDKQVVLDYMKRRTATFVGPNGYNLDRIAALHDLGYLPIIVKSLPEGSLVNPRIPCMTIANTKSEFAWITNVLETVLSAEVWKPVTSATTATAFRTIMMRYAKLTGAPLDFVDFQGHDFSLRGMSGWRDGIRCGASHLMLFKGTDTVGAIDYLEHFYGADPTVYVGGSVPATEHAVMCLTMEDGEFKTFERLITQYSSGIISIVSDTWDFWRVITDYLPRLKGKIMIRTPDAFGLAKVVIRPDSGDPVKILSGYKWANIGEETDDTEVVRLEDGRYMLRSPDGLASYTEVSEAEVKGAVECLWDTFGGTYTNLGFKQLNERIGLIYGDSITRKTLDEIFKRLWVKGFSSNNFVSGIGSYAYQYVTRDTLGIAVKATYAVVNGWGRNIVKSPKTDDGTKHSACGLLRVEEVDGDFVLHQQQTPKQEASGSLIARFIDGLFYNLEDYQTIYDRLHKNLERFV